MLRKMKARLIVDCLIHRFVGDVILSPVINLILESFRLQDIDLLQLPLVMFSTVPWFVCSKANSNK